MLHSIGSLSQRAGVHQVGEGRRRTADGIRAPRLQVVRPASPHRQAGGRRGIRGHREESATRNRTGARAHRAAGRLFRQAKALPERRFLLRADLRGDGHPGGHVHGAVRHPANLRLACAVGGDADGSGDEDHTPATGLRRPRRPRLRARSIGAADRTRGREARGPPSRRLHGSPAVTRLHPAGR